MRMISSWSASRSFRSSAPRGSSISSSRGSEHDRAGERDTLLLAPGELSRVAIPVLSAASRSRAPRRPARAISVPGDAAHLEREGDVLGGGHVREQRVVLEHHPDVAPVGRDARHVLAVDLDRAARSAARNPATIRSVVVLPEPDGPSSVRNSPRRDVEVDAVDGDGAAERLAAARGGEGRPRSAPVAAAARSRSSAHRRLAADLTKQQHEERGRDPEHVVDTAATVGSTTWRTCSHISTGSVRNRAAS